MTELQGLPPCDVDLDNDIVIKISAHRTSVKEVKSTCNAVPILKKGLPLEIYFIAVLGATLSKIRCRCIRNDAATYSSLPNAG